MVSRVSLRPAGRDDASLLADLWVEFGRSYEAMDPFEFQTPSRDGLVEWMAEEISKERSEDELYVVAEMDGDAVGYVRAQILRPQDGAERHVLRSTRVTTLKIDGLMVMDRARRQGVATELVMHAESWGASRGATESFVISYATSPTSVPFYEVKMGYAPKTTGYWKMLPPSE